MELISPTEIAKEKVEAVQDYSKLAGRSVANLFRRPRYWGDILQQADSIGVGSLPIVILTGFFTGGVVAGLGAALYRAALAGEVRNERLPVPFLGPGHTQAAIDAALGAYGDRIQVTRFDSLAEPCAEAARLIAGGRVVAWYRGRLEFGPRALGHRSILADPSHPEMRDRINAMVKMREAFRPFAPAVSIEQVDRWFDVPPMTALPFMIMTVDVRPEFRSELPAITHVNGSARVQTVSAMDNREFHSLLEAVGKVTGREMVLNTSFNVKGQPIVNTPREALETFLGTGIEFLFLENTLVSRRPG